jgi:signal peptidase I
MNTDFWKEVESLITPAIHDSLEYRLYYNELGEITSGSMVKHAADGNYIIVTKSEYDRYFDYHVVNGQLKKIDQNTIYSVKLERSVTGFRVVKNHASLIIEPAEAYTDIEYYEYRNN